MTLDEWKAARLVSKQNKMPALKEAIQEARRLMTEDEDLIKDDPEWEERFRIIFDLGKQVIYPLLEEMGIRFDYYDPDTTYEEDVRAFVDALVEQFGPID